MLCFVHHALATKKKEWTKDMNFLQPKTDRLRKQCKEWLLFQRQKEVKEIISTAVCNVHMAIRTQTVNLDFSFLC